MRLGWHSTARHDAPGHGGGERLCAAHTAEARGEDPSSGKIAAVVPAAHLDEGLVGAPA